MAGQRPDRLSTLITFPGEILHPAWKDDQGNCSNIQFHCNRIPKESYTSYFDSYSFLILKAYYFKQYDYYNKIKQNFMSLNIIPVLLRVTLKRISLWENWEQRHQ